ncbi:MAG: DUF3604 domain-containing protein [Candidatus Thiodiazotropha sp. (ex Monitilora ramsayi)]|nr:DUF3604 domain-containing protein [Candidatus Thiodiazotropha sp. (ex Monitilora ramsayi)]
MTHFRLAVFVVLASTLTGYTLASDSPITVPPESTTYSPYLEQDFPNQVLFGDTHLHTTFSADAGLALATLTPDDAYRFAKGEKVVSSLGIPARLQRPLDFLVVADHAENLGVPVALRNNDPVLQKNDWGKKLVELNGPSMEEVVAAYSWWFGTVNTPDAVDPMAGTGMMETYWKMTTEAAEQHNQPGQFTALIGYEWTSGPSGNNLHRIVVFRDGKDRADQIVPLSAYDTEDPEALWDWLQSYESKTGGKVLALAHNGNLSNGLMFDDVTLSGKPLSADYAARRQRWEPIYEVTQIKGDGETHPALSPDDEFADFVTWDKGSFGAQRKTPDMLPREYARAALQRGLAYEQKLGVNPFKFGMLGSTDSHTGLATFEENNFFGKVSAMEPTNDETRLLEAVTGVLTPDDPSDDLLSADGAASGLAAVWARENTREAIWDAMNRREVYATTGTRIRVRVFAGYDFVEEDLPRADFAAHGYAHGVPMGADLPADPKGRAPALLIRALRDPDGANLDRVQVVKGWLKANGETAEKVYNIAWSGDRKPGKGGKLPAVGNTVDVEAASWSNSIGAATLAGYWQDPDFDPKQSAFYYIRVLEIPTPRWTTYDRKVFGVEVPENIPDSIQERAYTSPIWYQAKK